MSELRTRQVIFDGSNFLFRSAFSISKSDTPVFNDATIVSFCSSVRKVLDRFFVTDRAYIVWDDDGAKTWRREEYPAYKASRKVFADSVYKDRAAAKRQITQLLRLLGVQSITYPSLEADDTIGYMCSILHDSGSSALVVSSDKDFLQLVDKGHAVFHPDKDTYVDLGLFVAHTGMTVEQYRLFRAVVGDPSDNITGVVGVGEKSIKTLFEKYPGVHTLEGMIAAAVNVGGKRLNKLLYAKDVILRNLSLMEIAGKSIKPVELDYLTGLMATPVPMKEEEAIAMLQSLGKSNFELTHMEYLKPFRMLRKS